MYIHSLDVFKCIYPLPTMAEVDCIVASNLPDVTKGFLLRLLAPDKEGYFDRGTWTTPANFHRQYFFNRYGDWPENLKADFNDDCGNYFAYTYDACHTSKSTAVVKHDA